MSHGLNADVKDGKIVRIRPVHYDVYQKWEDLNPYKIQARGKVFEPLKKSIPCPLALGYKKRVYSPNRIKYPLKRVDWEPGGDPAKVNSQNRGKSKFKRISWDEAATLVANEITRIKAKYGPYAILAQMDGHGENKNVAQKHGAGAITLQLADCRTTLTRNPDSWEGWNWGAMHVWGQDAHGKMGDHTNVWVDALKNTEMIIFQGCDPETTTWGWGLDNASLLAYWLTEVGIKCVYVCPELNYGAAVHADKWIPVLPNTDMALHLALANVWINEGTYDKAFVEDPKYCVGFDKYRDYVLGKEDGVPKTPEWASPLCGVPVWTIKALARQYASKVTSGAICNGGSHIRGPFSHEPARLYVYNLAMQGLGKPGVHQLSFIEGGAAGLPVTYWTTKGATNTAGKRVAAPSAKQTIMKPLYHEALLNPPVSWYDSGPRTGQFVKRTYPLADGGGRVHGIWMDSPCNVVCWQHGNRLGEGFRDPSIEFIVAEHQWLEDDCLYADIILPVCTKFEVDDVTLDNRTGQFDMLVYEQHCIEPIGESKCDYDCAGEVAKKLGLYDKYTEGLTYEQRLKMCWEKSNITDIVSDWEGLQEKGYFVIPVDPNWEKLGVGGLSKFRQDPVANPLSATTATSALVKGSSGSGGTQTGKFEFECQDLKDKFPDDRERSPVAHWVIGGPGWTHDESLWGERAKKYTLLLETNHPRWRIHAQHDDNPWLREIPTCKVKGPDGYMYEPVWINPVDAAKRGIVSGDIVKLYNDRGTVLGGAIVWERIIPGAVYQDHGARLDPITDNLDRGGSNNMICPNWGASQNCLGSEATSGYLVELAKVDPAEMEEWRKKYPEAFARDYDPAYGPLFSGWIEGGV
jgi:molybdopterin guanine dinucleotide-containing S/N-oxide reductase-like protein